MKNLILGAALAALAVSPALAFGPSTSDANPPGALFQSKPDGWTGDGTPNMGPAANHNGVNSAPAGLRNPDTRQRRAPVSR